MLWIVLVTTNSSVARVRTWPLILRFQNGGMAEAMVTCSNLNLRELCWISGPVENVRRDKHSDLGLDTAEKEKEKERPKWWSHLLVGLGKPGGEGDAARNGPFWDRSR
jgi:hypothetical protein